MKLFYFTVHLLFQILVFHVCENYASGSDAAEDHELKQRAQSGSGIGDYFSSILDWGQKNSSTTNSSEPKIHKKKIDKIPDLQSPAPLNNILKCLLWILDLPIRLLNSILDPEIPKQCPLKQILQFISWITDIPNRLLNIFVPELRKQCPLKQILQCIGWIVDVPSRFLDIINMIVKTHVAIFKHILDFDCIVNILKMLQNILTTGKI